MVRSTLAPHTHKNLERRKLKTTVVPRALPEVAWEGLQDLQPLRVRPDDNLRLGLGFRHGLGVVARLTGGEARLGKILATWGREAEGLARGKRERVGHGIEGELAGERHCGHDDRRGEEVHR